MLFSLLTLQTSRFIKIGAKMKRRALRTFLFFLPLALAVRPAVAAIDLAISFDEDTALQSLTPADHQISAHDTGGAWSDFFAALTAALPAHVNLDALSALSPTDVYFSLEEDALIGAVPVASNDVIYWNGSAFSVAQTGAGMGLPAN